jgi:hypothetical protein
MLPRGLGENMAYKQTGKIRYDIKCGIFRDFFRY